MADRSRDVDCVSPDEGTHGSVAVKNDRRLLSNLLPTGHQSLDEESILLAAHCRTVHPSHWPKVERMRDSVK